MNFTNLITMRNASKRALLHQTLARPYLPIFQLCHEVYKLFGGEARYYIDHSEYEAYIEFSARWAWKRTMRKVIDGHACRHCGAARRLQVHHKTYDRLRIESMRDLVTLCAACHAEVHAELDRMKESA